MIRLCTKNYGDSDKSAVTRFNKIDNKIKMLNEALSNKTVTISKNQDKWFINGDNFSLSGNIINQYLSGNY